MQMGQHIAIFTNPNGNTEIVWRGGLLEQRSCPKCLGQWFEHNPTSSIHDIVFISTNEYYVMRAARWATVVRVGKSAQLYLITRYMVNLGNMFEHV